MAVIVGCPDRFVNRGGFDGSNFFIGRDASSVAFRVSCGVRRTIGHAHQPRRTYECCFDDRFIASRTLVGLRKNAVGCRGIVAIQQENHCPKGHGGELITGGTTRCFLFRKKSVVMTHRNNNSIISDRVFTCSHLGPAFHSTALALCCIRFLCNSQAVLGRDTNGISPPSESLYNDGDTHVQQA